MEKNNLRKYVMVALFAALTFLATGVLPVKIPIPATGGYVHLGDTMIIAASMLFGPWIGGFSGAIGSSLADLFGGYVVFILPTFLIKGIMGFVVGYFCHRMNKISLKNIIGFFLGLIVLVGGYYIAEVFITSSFLTPVAALIPNLIQYAVGAFLGVILYLALKNKIKY